VTVEAQEWLERGFASQTRAEKDLHEAIRLYERALAVDPSFAKAHYQLVAAYVALGRAHDAVARYEQRLAERPDTLSHRCLAQAYVGAGRWGDAQRTIDAGLALARGDAFLLEQEGELLARTGRAEEALAAWRRALDADATSIGGHYSRAFLLERLGRPAEAAGEWEAVIAWCRERGYDEDTEWPQRELARLRQAI
jgi:tetratricopeptide (TPR) repeat protein